MTHKIELICTVAHLAYLWCYKVVLGLANVNVTEFFEFSPCHNTRGHKYKLFSTKLLLVCVQIFSVNVLSTSGTSCLMMSVSTLFIGLDVVSCILICLVTLSIALGLADFHFLLPILCVLLIFSRLIRATIGVFFVPYCPVLLSVYLVLSYMFELNKWGWRFTVLM